jgi:hypothetical protein
VFVDGKAIGTTPIQSYKVTAGKHTVEWRWDDGKKVTETITIEEDGVQTLKRG